MQKVATKMLLLTFVFTFATATVLASELASENKRIEAVRASTDIWAARVIDASPVGHGAEEVSVSYKIRPTSFLKTSAADVWVNFLSRRGAQSYGSDYETSLRKGQEWIFFLKKVEVKGNVVEWELLRVEQIEKKEDIIKTVERVNQNK